MDLYMDDARNALFFIRPNKSTVYVKQAFVRARPRVTKLQRCVTGCVAEYCTTHFVSYNNITPRVIQSYGTLSCIVCMIEK